MARFFSSSLSITSLTLLCFCIPSLSSTSHPDTLPLLSIASSLSFSRYPSLYSWASFSLSSPCFSLCYGITCNSTISSTPRVSGLHLHGLSLEGSFPIAVTDLSELRTLDLHGNRLSGPIPRALVKLKHLVELNLADNLFSERIPAEVFGMVTLQVLDLHANRLSGAIPAFSLEQLSQLRYFNVCSNDMLLLEGPTLKGQCSMWKLSTQTTVHPHHNSIAETPVVSHVAEFVERNYSPFSWYQKFVHTFSVSKAYKIRMRGERLANSSDISSPQSKPSNSTYHDLLAPAMVPVSAHHDLLAPALAPSANKHMHRRTHKRRKASRWLLGLLLGISVGVVSAVLTAITIRLILKYVNRVKNRLKPLATVVFQHKFIKAKDLAFLQNDSTLEKLKVLGCGGSGQVYKAVLDTGKTVAIKQVYALMGDRSQGMDKKLEASSDLTKNSRQICAELKTLAQVRHRNLVSLLAYIPTPNAHLLVYDYMENGSLHNALSRAAEGTLDFTWPMRYNVALGVANGLQYLHFESSPRIIHRDLKPANILLDAKMEAHIGDFGIAKVMPEKCTHVSTTNVAGTVGYIAPEFSQTLMCTDKGDVYSYGVVLGVLLTGKEPTDAVFVDRALGSMSKWMMEVIGGGEERVLTYLDPKLVGLGFDSEMLLAFKLAAFCMQENPLFRPSITQVVQILTSFSTSPTSSLAIPPLSHILANEFSH